MNDTTDIPAGGTIPAPTVRASLASGFRVLISDLVPLLVVGFGVVTVGGVCASLAFLGQGGQLLSIGAYLLITGPLSLGMSFVCLRAVRSGRVNFEHLLAVFSHYGSLVLATALIGMILPGAAAFLLLPGIAFFCATRFVPFLLLEDELGGAAAIIESIRLSRGCFWQLVGICAVGFLATVLGGITVIGLVPAILWRNLSLASLYHARVRPPKGWAVEDEDELEMQRISTDEESV